MKYKIHLPLMYRIQYAISTLSQTLPQSFEVPHPLSKAQTLLWHLFNHLVS